MHSKIDCAHVEGFLNLFGEHSFGADLREGDFLKAITGGLDDLDFDAVTLAAKQARNMICLPESELRATAADAEIHLRPTALGCFSLRFASTDSSEAVLESVDTDGISVRLDGRSATVGSDHASQSASTRVASFSRAACLSACIDRKSVV